MARSTGMCESGQVIARDGMYAGFASLQGCNLLGQCRSNCRGAKTGHGGTAFRRAFLFSRRRMRDCWVYPGFPKDISSQNQAVRLRMDESRTYPANPHDEKCRLEQ